MTWKNTVQRGRPYMTIWRKRIAYWIHKATNTYSQYVTHIAFPLQQWLQERASELSYTYIAYLAHKYIQIFYFLKRKFRFKLKRLMFDRRHYTFTFHGFRENAY